MNYDLQPMLCPSGSARQTIPTDINPADWACEPKLDGWRLICHRSASGVSVYGGRNGSSYTGQLPYLEASLMLALPPDTVVDGEIIAPAGWGGVQHTMRSGQPHQPSAHSPALTLVIFDVLRVTGNDVRAQPWTNRRRLVELIALEDHMKITPILPTEAASLDLVIDNGGEGVVLKRKSSRYINWRSPLWIKVKPQDTAEAKVTGFKAGEGSFAGLIGAIEFEMLDAPHARSRCSGFDMDLRREITANQAAWLGQVIEIKHHGISAIGKPRHPQFLVAATTDL